MSTPEEEENEFLDLPDDPEEAFSVLQRRQYRKLEDVWKSDSSGTWYHERKYVDTLVAFDEVHDLGILTAYRTPPTSDNQFSDFFQDFAGMRKLPLKKSALNRRGASKPRLRT